MDDPMIECKGIHEANPCGYLAALGLLRLAHDYDSNVKLSWSDEGHAVFHTNLTAGKLAERLAADNPEPFPETDKKLRGLNVDEWLDLNLPTWLGRPDGFAKKEKSADTTPWVLIAAKGRGGGWFAEARKSHALMHDPAKWIDVISGWQHKDAVSPLGLDPSIRQESALQANTASVTGQIGTAGAVWSAVWGLTLLPVFPSGTAGWSSKSQIRYATWSAPFGLELVRSLVRAPITSDLSAYGVTRTWTVERIRTEQEGAFALDFAQLASG